MYGQSVASGLLWEDDDDEEEDADNTRGPTRTVHRFTSKLRCMQGGGDEAADAADANELALDEEEDEKETTGITTPSA